MEINKNISNKKGLGRGIGSLLGGSASPASQDMNSQKSNEERGQIAGQAGRATAQSAAFGEDQISSTAPTAVVAEVPQDKRIWSIAIDKIVPGIYQPRKSFNKNTLEELAASIKENGLVQPITVRKRSAGGFEIIAGERRWRAAQIAGMHEVPAIIRTITDKEALEIAIIENVQREDLDPIEEAESYKRLADEFGLSQVDIAQKVGKERSTVANALRLLTLPKEIKAMVNEKLLSTGHAKALMSLENPKDMIKLAKEAVTVGLSVRALEKKIKQSKEGASGQDGQKTNTEGLGLKSLNMSVKLAEQLAEQLQKSLGTKVTIDYRPGTTSGKAATGNISISFYGDDQLNVIYERIMNK